MSRYQRLHNNDSRTTILATTKTSRNTFTSDDEEDDSADGSLFRITDKHNGNSTSSTTTTNFTDSTATTLSSSEGLSLFDELNNCSSTNSILLDMDEEHITMDVPLLNNGNYHRRDSRSNSPRNNNNNNYDTDYPAFEFKLQKCHCEQPGFGANLSNKSTQEAKLKILLAISLCCIFMFIEFIGGYIAGSLAIMTDAAHLASDCISFVIGLVAIWLGSKPPDTKMSFGYKRMEVLGAIISVLGIWILTATLVIVAIQRVITNDYDLDVNAMMIISGIGILINIIMVFVLHGSAFSSHGHSHGHTNCHSHSHSHPNSHSHSNTNHIHEIAQPVDTGNNTSLPANLSSMPKSMMTTPNRNGLKQTRIASNSNNGTFSAFKEKNLNLRAAMIHVIGDLVQSIGVFLSSVLIKFFPKAQVADPLCTLLFSIIVIMTTVHLFKESVSILVDSVPKDFPFNDLELDLKHIDGVKSVHHLNVWDHTSNHSILMVHLVIDFLADSNTILEKATKLASGPKYDIKHSTIQIERLSP